MGLLDRRRVLKGAAALLASGKGASAAMTGLYFTPSGRVGFAVPDGFVPEWSTWRFASPDGAFAVWMSREGRRCEDDHLTDWDNALYSVLGEAPAIPGFESRWLLSHYQRDDAKRAELLLLRNAEWRGSLELEMPDKPHARTDAFRDGIFGSLGVRAPLTLEQGLAELKAEVDLTGLNATLRPPHILFSPNVSDWLDGEPQMDSTWLSLDGLNGLPAKFDWRELPLVDPKTLVRGRHAVAVIQPEEPGARDLFGYGTMIMQGRRTANLSACYEARDREAVRAAVDQVIQTIRLDP